MTSTDLHQVSFTWPHPEPTTVIVTGTFDEWSSKLHMTKASTGFEAMIRIPWESKIKYKFVVDGQWLVQEGHPTEMDPGGFVNNIYTAPTRPILQNALTPESSDKETVEKGVANGQSEGAAAPSNGDAPKDGPNDSKFDNLANTIVASDGTTSALEYVVSGLGAAMHSVVGVDPINTQKVSIPSPKLAEQFPFIPRPMELTPEPAKSETSIPSLLPPPVAPIVPIIIVPVNTAENNTIPSLPSPEQIVIPLAAPKATAVIPDPSLPPKVDVVKEALTVESTAPEAEAGTVVERKVLKDTAIHVEEEAVEEQAPASLENVESVATLTKIHSTQPSEVVVPPTDKEPGTSTPPASSCTREVRNTLVPGVPVEDDATPADLTTGPAIVKDIPSPAVTTVEETPSVTQRKKEDTLTPAIEAPLVFPVKEEKPASFVPAIIPTPNLAPDAASAGTAPAVTELKPDTVNPVEPSLEDIKAEASPSIDAAAPDVEGKRENTEVFSPVEPTLPVTHQVGSGCKPPTNASIPPSTPPRQEKPRLPSVPESHPHPFPSTSASVSQNSPSSSKLNSTRKKKTSIFGRLKNIFHSEKEKEKKK